MLTVLGWFLISWVVCVTAVVNRPPMITAEPRYNVFYKPKETVELLCEGNGVPWPTFSWTRNGQDYNPSGNDQRVVQLNKKGTLVFNSPEDKDEGMFQCIAYNDFGVATSIMINMRVAVMKMFANAPPIIHEPTLGMGYALRCTPPENVPPAQVFWTYKDELGGFEALSYSQRVTMDREFTLRFAHIERADENNGQPYACMAVNNIMRNNSLGPPHYIRVKGNTAGYQPAAFAWSDSDDRFGLKGQSLSIKCIFTGNKSPDVLWDRTGNKSIDLNRAKLMSFSQELLINDLQYEDAGQYECMGSNSVGKTIITRTFNIRVNSVPSFLERPTSVETEEDATVRFYCRAEGVPKPDIRWFINGVKLSDSKDPRLTPDRFKTIGGDMIQMERVQLTDFMVFQCNASNIHGYVFANAYLNVLSEAPVIIGPPETMKIAAEGIPINITCRTSGKPTPIITWFKDGTQVTGGRYQVLSTGDLHINQLVLADAGHYVCEARNKHNVTDASGGLVVRRKTRIEQKPGDLERNAGMDAKFTCSGTTDPEEVTKLRILWLKDGKQISGSDERMMTNFQDNSLTISGTITRDTGTYTCVATNGLDSATASAVLTVKDRPDAPSKVEARDCKDTVIIDWMPGSYNNAPIQYYVLQYNTLFNLNQWNFGTKVNASVHQKELTLSPWVTYTFRVIAYNKIGPSNPSDPTNECTTEKKSPSYNPKNLRTLGNHPNTLYIEWTPIPEIQQNAPGFVYILVIVLTGRSETDKETVTIENGLNYYEMNTGKVYERYNITIRAENSIGSAPGDPTKIVGRSYEAKPTISPSAFTALKVEDTKVQFMWDFDINEITKVTGSKIRGEFRGFKIQFWQENNPGLTIREADIGPEIALNKTTNTFNATVSDMLPNTHMEARISVMNNFYVGPPTEPIKFYTKPGYPGPVDYFRILNIGDTHVNLEWGAPEETRGDLVGYDISYQLVDGLDLSEMQDREPQINDPFATNTYLSGLEPNKRYRVHIFARTQKGRGEGYFIELVTAKPGTPRMPRFKVVDVGQHYINITWWVNAYYSSGSVVFVEYRKIDGAEWIRTSDEVVNTWKNISNLEAGTSYEVRIKATNGPRSVSSSIAEVTTDGTAIASALVGNIGWFLGMLFSILVLIGLIILFVLCYRNGFRLQMFNGPSFGNNTSGAYSGTYDNTARMDQSSDKFGPEPKGYNNDYYDDKDYVDSDNHHEPPGYNASSAHSGEKAPFPDDYEDYNRKPSRDYDDDYDRRQANAPSADDYYRDYGQGNQDGYYDRGGDDGYYDRRNDDYYDRRDDDYYGRDGAGNGHYDHRDDGYDRRDDDYDHRDNYYDRRDNNGSNDRRDYDGYDRDKRDYGRDSGRQGYDYDSDEPPRRASSSQGGGDGGHSSTVV